MDLRHKARWYAQVIGLLYGRRDLRGRLVSATRGARHLSLGVRLADPLKLNGALSLSESLALATSTPAVIAQRLRTSPGLVHYQFQLADDYWQSYTRLDVTGLGVGLGDERRQIDFSFDPPHALVAGTTGSGKSETVRSILYALLSQYTPHDLGIVMVDPHHDFEDFDQVEHRAVPIARTFEEIGNALAWAGQELARRRDANFRQARRIVVVIDEAEEVLSNEKLLDIAQRIAAEARKFLMNLIISTQRPMQKSLPNLIDKLGNRWVGLVDNARTSAYLTGQAGLACHKLTGRGDFVHVAAATGERLQVARVMPADVERLPRAEIAPVKVEPEDDPRILAYPLPKSAGGRPPAEIDPRKVAAYLHFGLDNVSIGQARERLDLRRYAHYAHRDFAAELLDELTRLKAAQEENVS